MVLPDVSVCKESNSTSTPNDASFKKRVATSVVQAVQTQLARHATNDGHGARDRNHLVTREDSATMIDDDIT